MRIYPSFRAGLVAGVLGDLETATWKVWLCDATAVFDDADAVVGDLSGVLGGATMSVDYTAAGFWAGSVSVSGPGASDVVTAVVVTVGATNKLVAWLDTRSDGMPIKLVATGDPVDVSWPAGLLDLGGGM